ncbi:MAG: hypothetical protein BWZ03_00845 [bacterium ADurb.BinA186]|nr:MAG: hypothetical protein BWZ03_00845 [bacterium ADurb.BinA186]
MLDQISVPSAKFKADLKTAMLKNIGKGLPKEEIIASLKDLYPAMDGQINTLVNTSLQVFYKDATYSEVSQNFDYLKYSGPLDKVTRPYCREHVNKVYTKEEADVIQAEILTFYNCRHELIPISSAAYERG